ncbi:response regulator transcription factor [Falsiporphyromonas endometrii]|uniref:Response regulator transcription factor n=1 Tax=Falsiporphyromonas endometrii TaxID=1387297 RepID=A0ABV9K675_9PORP
MNNQKVKILIVDDEPDIREILRFNLENEGYEIDEASSAEEADKILTFEHRLILLDVMMGGMSGYQYASLLRKKSNEIPIIFLTAKNTENDMLTGFSTGADDYVPKPFSIKEVMARVKSILRRVSLNNSIEESILKEGDLTLDLTSKEVKILDQQVDLTRTEYNILYLLFSNRGKVFSRAEILDSAWPEDGIVLERTVDVHIARLRKKLGSYGELITNRTGYGYTFKVK